MNELKTIAMYLPQFHETAENNEWWGKGFTEWMAVKKANALFEGHNQPRKPMNGEYYNLLQKDTMIKQAELAENYELDGFCFYHYYFKDGRKVLEKPAENLLKWTDIHMPFCFCWANETWARTWSNIPSKNVWADNFENIFKEKKGNGVLLEQKYGREEEWKQHFEYLLPFFRDTRYIKIKDVPVFLIYKPAEIYCLAEMITYWKQLAKVNGIKTIYVIGLNTVEKLQGLDAILINGPAMYWNSEVWGNKIRGGWNNGVRYFSYDEVWKNAIAAEAVPSCKTYFGAFTDFDDTPRRGKKGTFLKGVSLEIYEKYLCEIMKKNKQANNEFQFINAFNEWGEGMYLEPDEKNGDSYLKITQEIKKKVNEENVQAVKCMRNDIKGAITEKNKMQKDRIYVGLLDSWMTLRERNIRVKRYLEKYGYEKIAVYGFGILGRHLVTELKEDGVNISYVIDQDTNLALGDIKVYTLDAEVERVDAVIVTAICDFDEIWMNIKQRKIQAAVVSLREIIDDLR